MSEMPNVTDIIQQSQSKIYNKSFRTRKMRRLTGGRLYVLIKSITLPINRDRNRGAESVLVCPSTAN